MYILYVAVVGKFVFAVLKDGFLTGALKASIFHLDLCAMVYVVFCYLTLFKQNVLIKNNIF